MTENIKEGDLVYVNFDGAGEHVLFGLGFGYDYPPGIVLEIFKKTSGELFANILWSDGRTGTSAVRTLKKL